ncbi:MAG: hypothetical protein IT190_07620 [Microbacteriaceae bacterium]|nr:hypothetical protein [Microbacteriaceae bacterium]
MPTTDTDKEIFLLKAMDYLEARRFDFQGAKANSEQSLQWPRVGTQIDCVDVAADAIPVELKKAQCQLVVEQQKRTILYPSPRTSTDTGFVTQKTVGPLTKKFSAVGDGAVNPNKPIIIASVEMFLLPLTIKGSCCNGAYKRTIRL